MTISTLYNLKRWLSQFPIVPILLLLVNLTMSYHNPVEFMRNYNPSSLKQMCASVIKQNYISNVNRMLDMICVEKFSASELSYFTGPSKEKFMAVLLYTLSMSSSTFQPFSSEVLGKLLNKMNRFGSRTGVYFTISITRATFAYHSFYDNLQLHVPLSTF